jgi:prophage endopeptidase
MIFNWKMAGIGMLCLLLLSAGLLANYYHGEYTKADTDRQTAVNQVIQKQSTINEMNRRQQDLAAMDAKNLQDLADAQSKIEGLRDDIATNRRRLQLSANCEQSGKAASSASTADAATARLTDAAQRDYFTLRDRIEIARNQILGLQEYIKTQCYIAPK